MRPLVKLLAPLSRSSSLRLELHCDNRWFMGGGGGGGAGDQDQSYIPLAKSCIFLSHQLHDEVLGKEVHAIRVRVKFASDYR